MTLGTNLKKYRMALRLSQREVAEKAGVHKISYYRYEKGKLLPTSDVLKKLALVLSVSLDDLLFTDEEKQRLRVSNKELLDRWSDIDRLSGKDRDALLHMIDVLLAKNDIVQNKKSNSKKRPRA